MCGEVIGQLLRKLAWVATGPLRHRERHVGGPVAVLTTRRTLEADGLGQRFDRQSDQGVAQCGGELVANHGVLSVCGRRSGA